MERRAAVLASTKGFGQVYTCPNCQNIHVQVGAVSLTLKPDAYVQLADMILTSAANFETWLEETSNTVENQSQDTE
jgi:hypothetical protein